jgi:hypothetical protein
MRIKKFKNLWTMGLLLTGGILILLYLIKLIFPTFVVGVAELPSIVKIGVFVDTHLWANILFTIVTSFVTSYFFLCACISEKKLNYKEIIITICAIIFLTVTSGFIMEQYQMISDIVMVGLPCLFCFMRKSQGIRYMYMTGLCFAIHSISQILSLRIRDISTRIQYPNSATFTILLIDAYIWAFLLYCFSNYKKEN